VSLKLSKALVKLGAYDIDSRCHRNNAPSKQPSTRHTASTHSFRCPETCDCGSQPRKRSGTSKSMSSFAASLSLHGPLPLPIYHIEPDESIATPFVATPDQSWIPISREDTLAHHIQHRETGSHSTPRSIRALLSIEPPAEILMDRLLDHTSSNNGNLG
jgi:hypothetical protein